MSLESITIPRRFRTASHAEKRVKRHAKRAEVLVSRALRSDDGMLPFTLSFVKDVPYSDREQADNLLQQYYETNPDGSAVALTDNDALRCSKHPGQPAIDRFVHEVRSGIDRAAEVHNIARFGLGMSTKVMFVTSKSTESPPDCLSPEEAPLTATSTVVVATINQIMQLNGTNIGE